MAMFVVITGSLYFRRFDNQSWAATARTVVAKSFSFRVAADFSVTVRKIKMNMISTKIVLMNWKVLKKLKIWYFYWKSIVQMLWQLVSCCVLCRFLTTTTVGSWSTSTRAATGRASRHTTGPGVRTSFRRRCRGRDTRRWRGTWAQLAAIWTSSPVFRVYLSFGTAGQLQEEITLNSWLGCHLEQLASLYRGYHLEQLASLQRLLSDLGRQPLKPANLRQLVSLLRPQ